jgi:hypothetical protein
LKAFSMATRESKTASELLGKGQSIRSLAERFASDAAFCNLMVGEIKVAPGVFEAVRKTMDREAPACLRLDLKSTTSLPREFLGEGLLTVEEGRRVLGAWRMLR